MGLDMYIYRCSKPDVNPNKIYDSSELHGIVLSEEDLSEQMYSDLAPYCEKVRVINHYYNMEKIRADYGLSDEAHIWSWTGSGITVGDKTPEGQRNVEISSEDIDRKYTISKEEVRFVCECDEEKYWRKAYDIQDFFYNHYPVENVGYYKLSKEVIEEFNRAHPDDAFEAEDATESSALFYHEWY